MSRNAIVASFALVFVGWAASANAQTALSSCNPATGLTPNGAPCVVLTPIDPSNINRPDDAPGGEQYARLDTTKLGQTYECRQLDARNPQYSAGAALLIEDCGTPLSSGELGELTPFYGTTGAPAPVPQPIAPVAVAPAPPVQVAAAPPAFAPVQAVPASGLSGTGLALTAVGAAALVGAIAFIASDDDDDDNSSTTTTRP